MTSAPAEPIALPIVSLGQQEPRLLSLPEYVSSTGKEAVELAANAGLVLDPWQAFVLEHGLGERTDGSWAAFEVGIIAPRQNGKNAIIEARELAGLFLLGEHLIIHSAHQFDTSLEAFRRLLFLIEDTPDLDREVKRVSRSHGEEGIELKSGQRIRFRTRTKGGGRGFSSDCLVLDEAMILPISSHGALMPTLSARPNPQVWYTGSAVDQHVHEYGHVLSHLRQRGLKGDDPALAFFEWSAEYEMPDELDEQTATSLTVWSGANPGLGIRISLEHVAHEQRSMDARTFAVERLGIGDWPGLDGTSSVFDLDLWDGLADSQSRMLDPVCFAFDVSPDRSRSCIAACGLRPDALQHLEIVEHGRGTHWIVPRLLELVRKFEPLAVICDAIGPAASLLPSLAELEIMVTTASARDQVDACGLIYDTVQERSLRHLGTPQLRAAIKGASQRSLGDAWAWSRKSSVIDISPLVAATLALWGSRTLRIQDSGAVWG